MATEAGPPGREARETGRMGCYGASGGDCRDRCAWDDREVVMNHTPGPWKLMPPDEEHSFYWVEIAYKREIVTEGTTQEEANVNAALVSMIPQMYTALKECANELDNYYDAEYPSDHPSHVRKRQYLKENNPARKALEETKNVLSDIT